MTRDEIIAILRKARDEWQNTNAVTRPLGSTPYPKGDPTRTLWEWQADALLAAQSDEATIADLKARGVLTRHPTWVRTKDGDLIPDEINEPHWIVVLPGPAMEDEK